jgi:serine/threonine protein kinase
MVGTPEYMSCEQARGLPDIDKRTDIYSMGVILYELLTGRLPFQSQHTGDLIVQIMTADPPKVHELRPEVGIPLSEVVARAMQRDRELRFPDIEQMHHAVIAIVEQDLGPRAAQAMSFPPAPFGPIDDVSSNIKIMGSAPTIVGRPAMAVPVASPAPAPLPVAAAPQIEQKPAPPARSWVWVAAGSATAVVVMVAAAFGFAYLWPKPPAASGAPRYIVVKSADETPRAEPPGQAQAPSPVASSETTATASTQPAKRAASPSTGRSERSRPKPVSAPTAPEVKLARAFAEQKAGIERCFVQYASELGQGTRLSVRIKLSAEGKVSEAEVSPANLAGAPLGSCIAQATRAMNFSPQPEPISFRVPLTAHRER